MDRYSIFEQSADLRASSKLRCVSTEDSDEPPGAMAERDLEATLQLLAERARYLTGASGASILLRFGTAVVCRASAGPSALDLGSQFAVDSGLMGESLRLHQILRCDDTEKQSRVGGETWRELGIRSVMIAPLVHGGEAVGVFELLADRAHSFEERDVATLQRLSEMILTALEHFDAARRPLTEASSSKRKQTPASESESGVAVTSVAPSAVLAKSALATPKPQAAPVFQVQTCRACGFPVSESRTLCLDCEEAEGSEHGLTPAFLGHLSAVHKPGWLQSHLYTVGTLFIAALTVALLVLKLR